MKLLIKSAFGKKHKFPHSYSFDDDDYLKVLGMRLRLKPGEDMPFNHLSLGRKEDGTFVVFIIKGNSHLVFEDAPGLFPSDTLVMQLTAIR